MAKINAYEGAELLVHPECGCTTKALALPPQGIPSHVLSTDGMLAHARQSSAQTLIVATEVGLLHRLRQENPEKQFIPAQDDAICPYMKMTTLAKIRRSLESLVEEVKVPEDIRRRALIPLERMVAIGARSRVS